MSEEVCAFGWLELSKSVSGRGFESLDGSGRELADMSFELCEGVLNGVEIGAVGRQVE